jgi:hypothetical protein
MFSLVYVSSAVELFSQTDLHDLLAKSRANNAQLDITGMLLYKSGNFIQALEGEESKVRALQAKISRDPRHRGVFVLLQQRQDGRVFSDWSMGFRDLTSPGSTPPGYSEFMNVGFLDPSLREPNKAQRLLLSFKQTMT